MVSSVFIHYNSSGRREWCRAASFFKTAFDVSPSESQAQVFLPGILINS